MSGAFTNGYIVCRDGLHVLGKLQQAPGALKGLGCNGMGGSKAIIDALIRGITKYGGQIKLSSHVEEVGAFMERILQRLANPASQAAVKRSVMLMFPCTSYEFNVGSGLQPATWVEKIIQPAGNPGKHCQATVAMMLFLLYVQILLENGQAAGVRVRPKRIKKEGNPGLADADAGATTNGNTSSSSGSAQTGSSGQVLRAKKGVVSNASVW
eukprot:1159394-Pelagomonas_calceolata.AAC.13